MRSVLKHIAIPLAALGLLLVPATSRAASDKHAFSGIPVTGAADKGASFSGTMDVLGFINDMSDPEHPTLKAIVSVTGAASDGRTVTNAIGLAPVNPDAPVFKALAEQQQQGFGGRALSTSPAQTAQATAGCQVLDLVLGPLHLDLLGLVVDLNQVHLNITAQPGSGNLLGNLVCAIANLLNGSGSGTGGAGATLATLVNSLATMLNNLLAML
jgi:hypothetical protein